MRYAIKGKYNADTTPNADLQLRRKYLLHTVKSIHRHSYIIQINTWRKNMSFPCLNNKGGTDLDHFNRQLLNIKHTIGGKPGCACSGNSTSLLRDIVITRNNTDVQLGNLSIFIDGRATNGATYNNRDIFEKSALLYFHITSLPLKLTPRTFPPAAFGRKFATKLGRTRRRKYAP